MCPPPVIGSGLAASPGLDFGRRGNLPHDYNISPLTWVVFEHAPTRFEQLHRDTVKNNGDELSWQFIYKSYLYSSQA